MSDDLYRKSLFDYVEGVDAQTQKEDSDNKATDTLSSTNNQGGNESSNVVSFTSRKLIGNEPTNKQPGVSTDPNEQCTAQEQLESSDSHLGCSGDSEEEEIINDDFEDEDLADQLELAGQSGNTPTRSETPAAAASSKDNTKEKKIELTFTTYICYAGVQISITKFFAEDKIATLNLEDVRKRLEKDYPELSKQRTKMDWNPREAINLSQFSKRKTWEIKPKSRHNSKCANFKVFLKEAYLLVYLHI